MGNILEASRAVVRLICFLTLVIPCLSVGQDIYEIELGASVTMSSSSGITGAAITSNKTGDIFLLVNPLGRVIISGRDKFRQGEFVIDDAAGAVDIASDGGLGAFICNPFSREITHLNRTGEKLPSLSINSPAAIEPVSLTATRDGRVFLINGLDGDIWRIERDGSANPLLISPGISVKSSVRLDIDPVESRLLVLEKDALRCFRLNGESLPFPKLTLAEPRGFAVVDDGIWVVGLGLEFIPFTPNTVRLFIPPDSLQAWQIPSPVDVTAPSNELIILTDATSKVLDLKLVRRAR